MSSEQPVSGLIARWQKLQALGQTLTLRELLRDCPERIEEVKQHLVTVASMEALLNLSGSTAGSAQSMFPKSLITNPIGTRTGPPSPHCCILPTTRFWANWAAAAWVLFTRPGTRN